MQARDCGSCLKTLRNTIKEKTLLALSVREDKRKMLLPPHVSLEKHGFVSLALSVGLFKSLNVMECRTLL